MSVRRLVAALLLTASILALIWLFRQGQAQPVPDGEFERIACLSYAAFRLPGETPLDPTQRVSEERLEADLRFLSSHTNCVRSYSVGQGMDALPRVAQRLGMKVLLGIWIGRDARHNEKEIALGIETARAYPDTVTAVIVGNEVLLRGEQPAAALAGYLGRVRAAVPQPVTYADVWEFWLRNAQLAEAASFITVHILPFWEDNPVPVEHAVEHVMSIYDKVQARFAGRRVLIGETGWPTVGRNREGALPSRVNAARFVRGVVTAAEARGIGYNVVEAFDQPWKRQLEGAVGGYWGIFGSDGSAKFPLHGPVVEEPRWRIGAGIAAALGLLFALSALWRGPRVGARGATGLFASGLCAGVALAVQLRTIELTARTPFEWTVGIAFTAASLLAAFALARMLAAWLGGGAVMTVAPIADFFTARARWTSLTRFVLLFGTAATNLLLAFDARYRDFPIEWLFVPAVGFALVAALDGARIRDEAREERLLAALIALSLPIILALEGVHNLHALIWLALCALLAASAGLPGKLRRPRRAHEYQQA